MQSIKQGLYISKCDGLIEGGVIFGGGGAYNLRFTVC